MFDVEKIIGKQKWKWKHEMGERVKGCPRFCIHCGIQGDCLSMVDWLFQQDSHKERKLPACCVGERK